VGYRHENTTATIAIAAYYIYSLAGGGGSPGAHPFLILPPG